MFPVELCQNRTTSGKSGGKGETSEAETRPVESTEIPRCVLVGPKGSGKTALLFQYGLSLVSQGRRVTFISHETLHTMPLKVAGTQKPDQMALKQLQILYLNTQESLLQYLSSVHTQAPLPTAILTAETAPVVARLCAYLVDAAFFISNKLSEDRSVTGRVLCPVVATVTPPGDRTALRWYERFLTSVWEVKGVAGQQSIYQLSNVSSASRDSLVVTYEISDALRMLDVQEEEQLEVGD
ncbi:PREDICTED: uncharacterized protein LOC109486959 [Branchiostoma belcheri]|uniref:Uncharacterized protein LOC109486959 n=1 Tax=Branchiostoma belcheri TaxID=7741 RepID=A0A6P5A9Z7_BRABE|nr:PREDICTED: uncharacterized protein LOC109486959 [Branchiostoma belcheri]